MAAPDPRLHTDAVLVQLVTSGLKVGDAVRPTDDTLPYLVLYPLTPALIEGSQEAADLSSDHWLEYQVTSVGATREQAEWAQQQARAAMATSPADPAGRAWMGGAPLLVPGLAVERDDGVQPPVFYAVDIYQLATTPA